MMSENPKKETLFIILTTLFAFSSLMSNLAGGKIVPFCEEGVLSAGVLFYPITFILGDLVTEIFGLSKAQFMVLLSLGMMFVAQFFLFVLVRLPFDPSSVDIHLSLERIFNFTSFGLTASSISYLVSQMIDINLYAWIKAQTGDQHLWIRSLVSTFVSQFFDTLIINSLVFGYFLGQPWGSLFWGALAYKGLLALALFPPYYLIISAFKRLQLAH